MLRRLFFAVSLAVLAVAGVITGPPPVEAAGKPLSISLAPLTQVVTEGGTATLMLSKSGGNGRASLVKITTSNGSFSGSIYPGNPVTIHTVDDAIVNGTRTITVTGTATTGAKATAIVTVLDNDAAPPTPQWVPAPLVNNGYARCKTVGGCHSVAYPCPPLLNTTGPVYCSYPNIIANYGDVRLQAWNGITDYPGNSGRTVAALWPVGHDPLITLSAMDWRLGVEGWQDEWEGVAPGQ
jgi:hypothetical protein